MGIHVLGIDIGGTKVAICLANEQGEVLASGRIPMQGEYTEVFPKIAELVRKLLSDAGLKAMCLPVASVRRDRWI